MEEIISDTRVDSASRAATGPHRPKSQAYAASIRRGILRIAAGRIHELQVEVRDDVVLLQGRCHSFYCKQLAQHAAMELAHEQRVDNQIQVV
jgi:osmotically-inducible protein OsmY